MNATPDAFVSNLEAICTDYKSEPNENGKSWILVVIDGSQQTATWRSDHENDIMSIIKLQMFLIPNCYKTKQSCSTFDHK